MQFTPPKRDDEHSRHFYIESLLPDIKHGVGETFDEPFK